MKLDGIHIYKPRRKKNYDYNLPGVYFVTICVKDKKCLFGDIKNETVLFTKAGEIAHKCILDVPSHYDNVEISEFVVMPNHVHAIFMIYESESRNTPQQVGISQTQQATLPQVNEKDGGTQASLLREKKYDEKGARRRLSKLAVVVGSYKSSVTRKINEEIPGLGFKWQRYYHDHIIMSERGLENVAGYIKINPIKWEEDLENIRFFSSLAANEREEKIKSFYKGLTEGN